jgi:ParB-like nuclease domain
MAQTETAIAPTLSELRVHPAADLFPMMSEDELADLAARIAENGQRQPIMLQNGVLIDGRNRLAACRLANVTPIFAELPADKDALAYIADSDARRNVTMGQLAMVTAFRYPEALNVGRAGNKNGKATLPFSKMRLSQARAVLHHSRSLAEAVLKGIKPLDAALTLMRQEQQAENSDEARLARLQKSAPDLAEQVNEERLKLNEAIAALTERETQLRITCDHGRAAIQSIDGDFTSATTAIVQAIAAGERLRLRPGAMKRIRQAIELLEREVRLHDSED